jgi:hypothetical protein
MKQKGRAVGRWRDKNSRMKDRGFLDPSCHLTKLYLAKSSLFTPLFEAVIKIMRKYKVSLKSVSQRFRGRHTFPMRTLDTLCLKEDMEGNDGVF